MNSLIEKLQSKNSIKNIIGLIFGALAGYLYYHFIGCTSGGCAITSNPYMSILWGAVMGYLLFDIYKIKDRAKENDQTP
jgi:hypothetical protein